MSWWQYLLIFSAWFGVCFVVCLPEVNTLSLREQTEELILENSMQTLLV